MTRRAVAPATLSARIADHVALEAQPNGEIAARFYGHSVALGKFSAAASHRAQARCAILPDKTPIKTSNQTIGQTYTS